MIQENKIFKIYKIDFPSGKCYIGQTFDINRRWREHLWEASVLRCDTKLYRAMAKYKITIENFSIIEDNILTVEEANAKEIYYIAKYDSYHNGYNSTLGGDSGFQPHGENHPFAILSDLEVKQIREIRASKKFTFSDVWEFYKDRISYSGMNKIWNYEIRLDVAKELDLPELRDFYSRDKRMMLGEKHFLSKLTDEQVINIRQRYWVDGEKMSEIYKDFKNDYSLSGFRKIVLGDTYTNIPMPQRSKECKKKKDWLKKEDVQAIRKYYKEGLKVMEIIRLHFPNCAQSTVCQIVHNKIYKNY